MYTQTITTNKNSQNHPKLPKYHQIKTLKTNTK
jgi:hypothetical protein